MKLGQKWDKMDAKETQNIKRRKYEPLWSYSGSNWQNMPKIYGWSWHKLNESTKWFKLVNLNNFNNSSKLNKFDKLNTFDKFEVDKFNKFDKFEKLLKN